MINWRYLATMGWLQGIMLIGIVLHGRLSMGQKLGCTDPRAMNFDRHAEKNDGSCFYEQTTVKPYLSMPLNTALNGNSGMVYWYHELWFINDHRDNKIYNLDTFGHLLNEYPLSDLPQMDWEELCQDEHYLYIGDFGNNAFGNRRDLVIYRIDKASFLYRYPKIDQIVFHYPEQEDFTPAPNATNFDCEAMLVYDNHLYLFTKEWKSYGTTLYKIPRFPGEYEAEKLSYWQSDLLITGADVVHDSLLILCGYSALLSPELVLLYGFKEDQFFSGNKRKIQLDLPFHQVEAIAHFEGNRFFFSNEAFDFNELIKTEAQLHQIDLTELLKQPSKGTQIEQRENQSKILIFPNPAAGILNFQGIEEGNYDLRIYNLMGQLMKHEKLDFSKELEVEIINLRPGIYFIELSNELEVLRLQFIKSGF